MLKKGHTVSVSISDDSTANMCYCGTLSCGELHFKMSSKEKVVPESLSNSSLGMVCFFNGAILVFDAIKLTSTCPSS